MARTVVAVFESVYTAKQAVWELVHLGLPRDRIDLIVEPGQDNLNGFAKPEKARAETVINELGAGVNIGAGIGGSLGLTGGLLFSLGTLHLPALLAALISGPQVAVVSALAAMGLCAAAGGLAGSLISGLVGLGISEEEIRQYAKNVHDGDVTVMIVADWDVVDDTLEALSHHNPLEIRQKAIEWHKASLREKRLAERALHVKVTEDNHSR